MLLGRLRIRGKLALLVLIPLLATLALTISNALELRDKADRAQETATTVRLARLTGELVRDLQQERLLAVGLLRGNANRAELSLQNAAVTEKVVNLRALGAQLPGEVSAALGTLKGLDSLRTAQLSGSAQVSAIFAAYGGTITQLIDSLHLLGAVDGDTPQGREVIALDAIMRANEGFATLLAAMAIVATPSDLIPFAPGVAVILPAAVRFTTYATAEQVALYQTSIAAVDARLGKDFAVGLLSNPGDVVGLKTLPSFAAIDSLTGVGRFVETKIINDVLSAADSSANAAAAQAVGFVAVALLTMLLAVLLGVAVARSVAQPLRRLTQSADRVARLAESELVRVADDDSLSPQPVRLQPVDVAGRDELGDLARAFGRVQETAARLVERQVASRRNVAQMFGHVGRRTQNLVGRQVALIDKLESDETEPHRLRELYRLDHISSRLRRSASSLVVLSGATGADEHMTPVGLGDVVRLALAEIEDYSRVDVDVATSVRVVPALINDLVLLLAELMENATTFSPPMTRVSVTAVTIAETARLTIVDHGLGMAADRLAEENARLTRRERLDLVPTEVLGLFVVGRLARRHGLGVVLLPTDGGGVTVAVDVPAHLLTAFGPASRQHRPGPPGFPPQFPPQFSGPAAVADRVGPMLMLANVDPAVFNVGALDRATRTLHSVQPWNAFLAPRNPPAPVESVPAPVEIEAPPQIEPPRLAPTGHDQPRPRPLSPLNRRVPGATLSSLEAQARPVRGGPIRAHVHQPPDADQARDSLADFESGVAKAMREVDRQQETERGGGNPTRDHEAYVYEDRRIDEEGTR